ncbi:MAG: Asp23/Gls24 family envelope stress response protein [Chloroflexi bacterium]|nr:Asp23/Gls24 family envelope stress response protein [Chloroflexota bacterium]
MSDEPTPAPLGKVEISPLAIATIAAHAVTRSYGVVGMAPKNLVDGIATTIINDPHKGIDVHVDEGAIRIDLYLIVEYGTRISSVARSAANTVHFSVERATGLPVSEVNVYVQGLRVTSTD